MPFRHWCAAIALGLIFFSASGQAQEQTDGSQREAEQSNESSNRASFAIPVDIIKDQAETEATERREKEADQREIEDLIAQQSMDASARAMNSATQDMRDYALYSTFLVGAGTILLIVTLWLTRQANVAAQRSIEVTREIGEAQTRAYILAKQPEFIFETVEGQETCDVQFVWANKGNTPASKLRVSNNTSLVPKGFRAPLSLSALMLNTRDIESFIPPDGDAFGLTKTLSPDEVVRWKTGDRDLLVFGKVAFNDVFSKRLVVRACIICEYRADDDIRATVYPHHNEQQRFVESSEPRKRTRMSKPIQT